MDILTLAIAKSKYGSANGTITTDSITKALGYTPANAETVSALRKTIADLETGVDETEVEEILDEYTEENSQAMGTLTINGQQYNGSEDVVVEGVYSSGGGSNETAQETQLATGTIVTETEASTMIETGVSLATLKQYKRFVFVFKGASNVGLLNTYLTFVNSFKCSIARSDATGGLVCEYEWVNTEENLLRCCNIWQGNPSLVRKIGSNYIVTNINASFGNSNSGGSYPCLFDLSDLEDIDTLKIFISNATTIEYSWEIRGLTV